MTGKAIITTCMWTGPCLLVPSTRGEGGGNKAPPPPLPEKGLLSLTRPQSQDLIYMNLEEFSDEYD